MQTKKKQPDMKADRSGLPRWVMYSSIVTLVLFLFATALLWTVFLYQGNYTNKVYAKVHIDDINVSGMTKDQLRKVLSNRITTIYEEGISVLYNGRNIIIPGQLSDPINPELSSDLWFYDIDSMIDEAYIQGRKNEKTISGRAQNIIEQIELFQNGYSVPIKLQINKPSLKKQLETYLHEFESPASDATLSISQQESGNYQVEVISQQEGKSFNYNQLIHDIEQSLENFHRPIANITLEKDTPQINAVDVKGLIPQISQILSENQPFVFSHKDQKWELSKDQLASLLTVKPGKNGNPIIGIDEDFFTNYIQNVIHKDIYIEPKNAVFVLENNRVTEFEPGANGQEVNIEKTKDIFEKSLYSSLKTIPLFIEEIQTEIPTEETNSLGIKELIGVGKSYFAGSPTNRRHNIAVGAASLDGLLIKPGEEFSLIKALGDIDGEAGYRTELVIKGDRTVPEYGGGLCQIGTTLFRGVLNTGLPITERRNHSYRVSYYEPAGTDATIYDPAPDFKFVNDTGNHILLQTSIEGSTAFFELWGTSDGRIAEQTDPLIYNIVPAGPTKYVESEELEPGEEKCVESPHDGATAEFDYKVTYPDGNVQERTFTSYYRPWPKVCLVGELSEEEQKESTDENPPQEEEHAI